MKRILAPMILLLTLSSRAGTAQAPAEAELKRLLNEFLAGASRNDPAVHDRFWADDLIYTGSSGRRIGKADIMSDVRSAPPPKPDDPTTTYSAEEVRVQQYGNSAIVAFRLVATTRSDGSSRTARFLNTGTFLERGGEWRAVAWQATRLRRDEEVAQQEVAAAHQAFYRAMLAADTTGLGAVTAEGFVWMQPTGARLDRRQLLEALGASRLYAKLETRDVEISLHGDAAIVSGVLERQRGGHPALSKDRGPYTAGYTLTLVDEGAGWKAVALHTSR